MAGAHQVELPQVEPSDESKAAASASLGDSPHWQRRLRRGSPDV
jgi:hypothetical protein